MKLNNKTTATLNRKIKTRRIESSRKDWEFISLMDDLLSGHTFSSNKSNELLIKALTEIVSEHKRKRYESDMHLDEIIDIRDTQVWMENRNK